MWPIFNDSTKNGISAPLQQRRPLELTELVVKMGDFSDLQSNDVALKFWLPEPAERALDEIGTRNELTKSEFLRQFFAIHCYGLYAFYMMKDAKPYLFKESSPETRVYYQSKIPEPLPRSKKRIETYWVPELGKNIAPIKVWMPKRLRNDLSTLAEVSKLTLSNYVREIIISRLLGQGMLPTRSEMFRVSATPAAEAWCEDQEVPWREVTESEFRMKTVSKMQLKIVEEDGV